MANYLDSEELKTEVIKCQASGIVSNRLGSMLMLIAANVVNKWRGENRDDSISAALVQMVNAVPRIDIKRAPSSIFSYLTMCAINGIKQVWRAGVNQKKAEGAFKFMKTVEYVKNTTHSTSVSKTLARLSQTFNYDEPEAKATKKSQPWNERS